MISWLFVLLALAAPPEKRCSAKEFVRARRLLLDYCAAPAPGVAELCQVALNKNRDGFFCAQGDPDCHAWAECAIDSHRRKITFTWRCYDWRMTLGPDGRVQKLDGGFQCE